MVRDAQFMGISAAIAIIMYTGVHCRVVINEPEG